MTEQENIAAEITDNDKLWALLAYITGGLFGLIILLMEDKKNNAFLKYHAVHSLVINVAVILASFLAIGLCLAPFVYIYGIVLGVKAFRGEYVEVPLVTDFAKKQGWVPS